MLQLFPKNFEQYELLDAGGFEKLERFGTLITRRPEPQAVWTKALPESEWEKLAHAYFKKEKNNPDKGEWLLKKNTPQNWNISYAYKEMKFSFRLGFSSFKHVGIFPEQADNWDFIYDQCKKIKNPKVLNLFAYTGGASLAARAAGADVTHVDSIKHTISWANDNMQLSELNNIRWVVEDAFKFVQREVRRGAKYNGIILDPPSYGRGPNGEKWILEDKINELTQLCNQLLVPDNGFLVFNLYSMGFSAMVIESLVKCHFPKNSNTSIGELYLPDRAGRKLPLGTFLRIEV
jgi:23S rRNA (cytosine1962-C5)-methyltransferase